jgi:3-hydroxybutyryl-CoA dehydrogenase
VTLVEISDRRLAWSLEQLREALNRDIARWSLTEAERDAIMARIHGRVSLEALQGVGVIIEAIQEDRKDKEALLRELEPRCPPETVLVTNTSTLSVTDLAEALAPLRRPWLVGLHFLHPVPRVAAVELVRGRETGEEAVETARGIGRLLGKEVVEVSEYPGYVTTRLTLVFINEAVHTLMEGVATRDAVDRAMKLRFGGTHGPLALADEMGLDSLLRALESLWTELGLPQFRPAPLLRQMVARGYLGEKSGRGFYRYDEAGNRLEDGPPELGRPRLWVVDVAGDGEGGAHEARDEGFDREQGGGVSGATGAR